MNGRLYGVGVAAAVLALATAGAARAEMKIGAVDIVQVTNDYQRTKDASERLKVDLETLKAEAERRSATLNDIRIRRDAFAKESKEWRDLDDQLLNEEARVRSWAIVEQTKVERRHRDVLLDMYRQITAVVARLAKDKKLDMVFTKAFLAPPTINVDEAQGLEDLKNRIMGQRILFPTDVADLTKDVTDILNKEYEAARKLPGAVTPGGLSPGSLLPMAPTPAPGPKAGGGIPRG